MSPCSTCSQLKDQEHATQKSGWPENDTSLPEATWKLVAVKDLAGSSDRTRELRRCPECGTHYLYESDYDYLAGGSEDSQSLRRLAEAEAAGLMG